MNKSITRTEVETLIKNSHSKKTNKQQQQKKKTGPDGLTVEFWQTFKGDLMPILLKLFQKITEKGMLPNSFYKATVTLIPKSDKNTTEKQN